MAEPYLTAEDREILFKASLPSHQEFFCRVVESYPRHEDGTLATLSGATEPRALQLEMFMLRNLAEFPVQYQRSFCSRALLTARFRMCIQLVVDTISKSITDDFTRGIVVPLMQAPAGENAAEEDLSELGFTDLWAVEGARLVSYTRSQRQARLPFSLRRYDACTYEWLRGGLAQFLGVTPLSEAAMLQRAGLGSLLSFSLKYDPSSLEVSSTSLTSGMEAKSDMKDVWDRISMTGAMGPLMFC
ncbi:hypothetical protein VNI00_017679 [Paramarasmius palmivorus]|uniref:Uncharacterized protein n=1 Tax=Paramarasmius palmivorus TaxID=297713 RepID=A0AAW0B4D9_9AGAR